MNSQRPKANKNEVVTVNDGSIEEDSSELQVKDTKVKQVSELIIQSINGGSFNSECFAENIASSHRWIQQAFYDGVLKPTIKKLAENGSDQRNERAVSECEQIVETVFTDE